MLSLASVKHENCFQIQVLDGLFLLGSELSPVMTEEPEISMHPSNFSPASNLLSKLDVQRTAHVKNVYLVCISHL